MKSEGGEGGSERYEGRGGVFVSNEGTFKEFFRKGMMKKRW